MKLMKLRLALAAALALPLAATAGIVIEELPASLALTQAVRLADGSVLPAGPYDVKIHYKGFGNAAELWFFQRGQLKGKSPAEARGFPAQAPAAVNGDGKTAIKIADIKGESTDKDHKDQNAYKEQKHPLDLAGAPQAFSWGAHGFSAGGQGKVAPAGRGSLKLSFDSSNSAAGFSAILPYIEKGNK